MLLILGDLSLVAELFFKISTPASSRVRINNRADVGWKEW
jgi:hypothetical protein